MYLEISGRQTGKTTRLADHASDELIQHINDPTYKIGIVAPSLASTQRIHKMVGDMFVNKLINNNWGDRPLPNIDRKIKKFYDMVPIREDVSNINQWYVDEFAFIHSDQLLRKENAYYCTTPNGNHPFTISLLNYCRHRQIEVESYDISRRFRNDFNFSPYVDEFDNWCIAYELEMYPHPFEDYGDLIKKYIRRHKF